MSEKPHSNITNFRGKYWFQKHHSLVFSLCLILTGLKQRFYSNNLTKCIMLYAIIFNIKTKRLLILIVSGQKCVLLLLFEKTPVGLKKNGVKKCWALEQPIYFGGEGPWNNRNIDRSGDGPGSILSIN